MLGSFLRSAFAKRSSTFFWAATKSASKPSSSVELSIPFATTRPKYKSGKTSNSLSSMMNFIYSSLNQLHSPLQSQTSNSFFSGFPYMASINASVISSFGGVSISMPMYIQPFMTWSGWHLHVFSL